MGEKMKGAKVLSKYAAPRLKRSRELPSTSLSADISGWLSFKSALSALSNSSFLSFVSIGSIGSAGSILGIGSAGSILSIGKAGAAPGRGSAEPEEEILTEEIPTTGEPRPEDMRPNPRL
jgi:hypothetical protein